MTVKRDTYGIWKTYLAQMSALLLQQCGTEEAYNRMIHEKMRYLLACLEELRLRTEDPALMPYMRG